jgi:Acetyltransferase (GNAT) domain
VAQETEGLCPFRSGEGQMIEVTIEPGDASDILGRLKAEWEELWADARLSPFSSWAWMAAWFDSFGGDVVPIILTGRREGKLVGILPLVQDRRSLLHWRITSLSMAGSRFGGADYLDTICRSGDLAECTRSFVTYIDKDLAGVDEIEFEQMPRDSATFGILDEFAEKAERFIRFSQWNVSICPQIGLTNWSDILSGSRRKTNFKRRLRSIEKMPGFEFRSVMSPDQISGAFERFLRLHDLRREDSGVSDLSGHPQLVAFHRRALSLLSVAGQVRFDELWIDDRCCASIYGLVGGGTFYYYNAGFDPHFSNLSVGLVLLGLSIRAACERGDLTYDFLRGDESYKFDWATDTRELMTIKLSTQRLPLAVADRIESFTRELVSFAGSFMPTSVIKPLRNLRQSRRQRFYLSA